MIDPSHSRLAIVRRCELVSISRSSFYREPAAESEETLRLMRLLDEQFLETPWYGSQQMARHLRRNGWMDNVFIERLWRSLKYECVFMNAFETGSEARIGIGRWIEYYNTDRPHSAFAGRTPDEVYAMQANEEKLAA